jgi:hypothetical protein
MTPDTSTYMIAGFVVILSGMAAYLVSLILRARALRKKAARLESREHD